MKGSSFALKVDRLGSKTMLFKKFSRHIRKKRSLSHTRIKRCIHQLHIHIKQFH